MSSINNRQNRTFWQKLYRGLVQHKKIRNYDHLFANNVGLGGSENGMGKIGKISNQFGLNYAQGTLNNRLMRYKEYELMVLNPLVNNALDAYANNATLDDVLTSHKILIDSTDEELKEDLEELFFVILELDDNLQPWARILCMYGDFIVGFKIDDDGKKGITDYVHATMHEIDIDPQYNPTTKRRENTYIWKRDGVGTTTSGFIGTGSQQKDSETQARLHPYELIHFSIKGDPVFEPFGKSIIEYARLAWKQLKVMEESMLLYRVVRAAERKVFKLEVGGLPNDQLRQYVQQAMSEIKRVPIYDPNTGDVNLQYNVQSIMEDYVFTQRNGVGSSIDTLPGGQNTDAIQDVEYFKSNLRTSLRVPKAFLEYDESPGTARGLAMEDQRFAASIKAIQSVIEKQLYKAAYIHLIAKGYPSERIDNFEIKLVNPSTQEEKDRLELLQIRNGIVSDILNSKSATMSYVRRNILQFSDDEIAKIETEETIEAKKRWELAQLETNGFVPENPEQAGGDKGMLGGMDDGLGGGLGGGGGGGSFGGGLSDFASGPGGTGDLGAGADLSGMGGDLGAGLGTDLGAGAGGNASAGLGGDIGGTGGLGAAPTTPAAMPASTPSGGTEAAGLDPLLISGDKLIDMKKSKRTHESYVRDIKGKKPTTEEQLNNAMRNRAKKKGK